MTLRVRMALAKRLYESLPEEARKCTCPESMPPYTLQWHMDACPTWAAWDWAESEAEQQWQDYVRDMESDEIDDDA